MLHSFTGGIYTGRDGQAPFAGLIADEQMALTAQPITAEWRCGHSFQVDAARHGPDRLD